MGGLCLCRAGEGARPRQMRDEGEENKHKHLSIHLSGQDLEVSELFHIVSNDKNTTLQNTLIFPECDWKAISDNLDSVLQILFCYFNYSFFVIIHSSILILEKK